MFAVRDDDPGGRLRRFQYYAPDNGAILRYDDARDDVTRLADYGLVFTIEDGRSNRPYLPYERVHLDVELVGDGHGEDPAPV